MGPLPRCMSEPYRDFLSFELFVFNTNTVVDTWTFSPIENDILLLASTRIQLSLLKGPVMIKKKCRLYGAQSSFLMFQSDTVRRSVSFKKLINFKTVDGSDEFFHHTVVFNRPISVSCYVRRRLCVLYRLRNKKEIIYRH